MVTIMLTATMDMATVTMDMVSTIMDTVIRLKPTLAHIHTDTNISGRYIHREHIEMMDIHPIAMDAIKV